MELVTRKDAYGDLVAKTRGFACYPQDHKFVAHCLQQCPRHLRRSVMDQYNWLFRNEGQVEANDFLSSLRDIGQRSIVSPQSTIVSIDEHARAQARACERSMRECDSIDQAYRMALDLASQIGISFHKAVTPEGAIKRICCNHWWFKNLKVIRHRLREHIAIYLHQVSRHKQVYASDYTVDECRRQEMRNTDLLAALEAVSECGDRVGMEEIRQHSLANPNNRRAELMAILSGFESYAISHGDVGFFVTLTCPSRMHATSAVTGKGNPKYDHTTPKQANEYLSSVWSRVRAKWKRKEIRAYGTRVVEPQHDGTPHWHILIFVSPSRAAEALQILEEYALKEDGNEVGAAKYRVKTTNIDYSKGSATGYIAKYISKNIDGQHVGTDTSGIASDDAAARVTAWCKTWRIRQFQHFGGPPVSIWRELRRVNPAKSEGTIKVAATYADNSDWEGFLTSMGGIGVPRSALPIQLDKVWSDKPGPYGDPAGMLTFGLIAHDSSVVTHPTSWTIEHKKAP